MKRVLTITKEMKIIKNTLKKILPPMLRQIYRKIQYKIFGIEATFKGMSTSDIFDKIYEDGIWGKDEFGRSTSGSGSHSHDVVKPYVEAVKIEINTLGCTNIVDLGCGDFSVGKNFIDNCNKYVACDISNIILEQNQKYYQYENLEFKQINLAEDELPEGDLAFVRQVLQHLSNTEIKKFVDYINKVKPYRYLLVTEGLPPEKGFKPNIDKPSGSNTRFLLGSGIELHREPFLLEYKSKRIICQVNKKIVGADALIRSTLYELN